jgi:hypothetical protein
MNSRECFENKWFYMKYIGKYLNGEILLAVSVFSIAWILLLCQYNVISLRLGFQRKTTRLSTCIMCMCN